MSTQPEAIHAQRCYGFMGPVYTLRGDKRRDSEGSGMEEGWREIDSVTLLCGVRSSTKEWRVSVCSGCLQK